MSMSVQKHKNLLTEYHEYADDTVDSPLLTPETVEQREE